MSPSYVEDSNPYSLAPESGASTQNGIAIIIIMAEMADNNVAGYLIRGEAQMAYN